MRITGGSLCGRQIKAPKGSETRPTQDRVRESLFGILGTRLEGHVALDLFAGSGSLGFEALSRGASKCIFVERSRAAAKLLEENARGLGVDGACEIICADALEESRKWLVFAPYGAAFVDPPYMAGAYERALAVLSTDGVMMPLGIVVVERERHVSLQESYGCLKLKRSERYGATMVDFYQFDSEV